MNMYGATARKHWERWLPARYSQLEDPSDYFTRLGEEISEQVDQLSYAIAGSDPPDEGYLAKVGRLDMARMNGESQVLREMALLDPEVEEEDELPVGRGAGRGAQIIHIASQRGIFSPFSGLPVDPQNGIHEGDPTLLLVYSGYNDYYDFCSARARRLVPRAEDMTKEQLAASLTLPDALLFVVDRGCNGDSYYAFAPEHERA
jgi:hypothetical protein